MNWEKTFDPRNPRSYGEYPQKPTPDKKHILVFDPGIEFRMIRRRRMTDRPTGG